MRSMMCSIRWIPRSTLASASRRSWSIFSKRVLGQSVSDMPALSSLVLQAREVEKPGARTGLFRLRRCSPGPRYPRCGYSASDQVFLHADEDRRCEAWRTRRFASMGPPSIDYSITLFGGEGNETHGSLSANNVVVVHVIAALGVRSWLFEHPNVLMGHPQPGVRPVSHAGTLDLHPLNELQSLPLQLLSVPLRHPHDLAAAN